MINQKIAKTNIRVKLLVPHFGAFFRQLAAGWCTDLRKSLTVQTHREQNKIENEKSTVSQALTVKERIARIESGPSCVDLFAGAGGLAAGFREAGWSIRSANDADSEAAATFALNFPEATFLEGPVELVRPTDLLDASEVQPGELGCLIGGPPCQSFSYNNHRRSAADERARLFEHYLRIVEETRPRAIVMENVPGILTIDSGAVIGEIRDRLGSMGYDTHVAILSAEEYGTPQVRRRVFIAASRVGAAIEMIPAPSHWSRCVATRRSSPVGQRPTTATKRIVTVWQAIGDLPPLPNGGGQQIAPRPRTKATTAYQKEARRWAAELYNHICHRLTEVNLSRIVHVPEGGNWRDVPRDLLPAGMQRARLKDHTKRYGRLDRDGLSATILTKCDPHWGAYVHPTQDRTISVREAARLQGFPDTFQFAGQHLSRQYEQVGNAVPVQVALAIAKATRNHLERAERRERRLLAVTRREAA